MFEIRPATARDAAAILQLIKDLAEYEKEPDKVVCTVADIQRDGFGANPCFDCLLAEIAGKPVGFALFFYKWSTWTGSRCLHLEDLFVKPEVRGQQIGVSLLRRLAAIAVENRCDRFEWDVLDWNTTARNFYHRLGAYPKDGWLTYRLEGEPLDRLVEGNRSDY